MLATFAAINWLPQALSVTGRVIIAHGHASRVLAYGTDGLNGVEHRYARLAASLVGAEWPTRRWPIHVFTAGAMTCLFTSSFCHLFGCCSWHFAQVTMAS